MQLSFLQIKEITLELLKVLQQTENDDITSVVQKVIATYYDTLAPIMYEICQNLVCILFIYYYYFNISSFVKLKVKVNLCILNNFKLK